ncbi:hypothetical protein ACKVWC_001461 [Pyricularia oryzae]
MSSQTSPMTSTEKIEHWNNKLHDGPSHETRGETGIVHNLCDSISLLYEELLTHFDPGASRPSKYPKALYRLVESCYAKFRIWASDHSVNNGKLDQVLSMSRRLQNFTVEIMAAICVILTQGKSMQGVFYLVPILRGDDKEALQSVAELVSKSKEEADRHLRVAGSDAGSESGCCEESDETCPASIEQVLGNLELHIKDLMDLGPELKDPIPDVIDKQHVRPFVTLSGENVWFCEQIQFRYPNIDPRLVEPCGKFLRDTLIRLQISRDQAVTEDTTRIPVQEQHEAYAPKPADRVHTDSGIGTSLATSVLQSQQSSQHLIPVPENVARSQRGSGFKASTVYTFSSKDGTIRAEFPLQPDDVAFGDVFPCRLCGKQMIKTERLSVWKKHVLSDLRPWICCQVSCPCKHKTYDSREDWIAHMTEQHGRHRDWDDKTCPFCRESIAQGGRDMIHHVEMHLQDMALTLKPGEDPGDDVDHKGGSRAGSNDSQSRSSPADGVPVIQVSLPDKPVASLTLDDIKTLPAYMATEEIDGFWPCPWQGEDFCQHEPTAFKEELGQFIFEHSIKFTCKEPGCSLARQPFSSPEGLRIHEQEAHGSRNPSQKAGRHDPTRFLCTSTGCGRSRPGNGFSNKWVLENHIRTIHGNLEL